MNTAARGLRALQRRWRTRAGLESDSDGPERPPTIVRQSSNVQCPLVCILRVLVGTQAAPASHASSRRALSTSLCVSPARRCHRAPSCVLQTVLTPRVGAATTLCACQTLCPSSRLPALSVFSAGRRAKMARGRATPELLHTCTSIATTPSTACTSPGTATTQRPARRVACSDFHGPQPRCSSTQSNMLVRPVLWLYLAQQNLLEACGCRHERAPQAWRVRRDVTITNDRTRLAPWLCKEAPHTSSACA
jgi:hypothetical protein